MSVAYSGTPLPKKLGITAGTHLTVLHGPRDYAAIVGELPAGAKIQSKLGVGTNLVHLFVTEREVLASELTRLRKALHPDTAV